MFVMPRSVIARSLAACVAVMGSGAFAAPPAGEAGTEAPPAGVGEVTTDTPQLLAAKGGVSGFTLLKKEMDEAQVRRLVGKGEPGSVFIIPPGASWTLKDTLDVPQQVSVIGCNPGSSKLPTFIKGFDGPLMRIHSWVTLEGLVLNGNREQFKGDGIVAGGPKDKGVREVRMTRVEASRNAGSGYVLAVPTYYSQYNFCSFDRNGGYAVVYGEIRSHHTDNWWQNCHYGWNDKGGIQFNAVEVESIWDNCEWFHNGGAAFEQNLVTKKLGIGKEMGERPNEGSEVLQIRSGIFRQCAGPVWLQRGGSSESIAFIDCRMKHNGDPADSEPTRQSGKTAEQLLGLTAPVAGMVHVEGGKLSVEFRGGWAIDGGQYLFTVGPKAEEGCRILISSSSDSGFRGSINNPRGYATILDRSLLKPDAVINVKSGIALDPLSGKTIALGPDDRVPTSLTSDDDGASRPAKGKAKGKKARKETESPAAMQTEAP